MFFMLLVNNKNIVFCSLLRRKCKLTIFPISVRNMMSHLTRFDSEMHEDKDDLETTRESKRSQIIALTTELEVSVDGTSADRKVRFHPHVPIVSSLILAPKLNFYHFCTLETNPSTHANQQSLRWPKLLSRGPRVKHLLPTPANQRKKVRTRNRRLLTRWRRGIWTRKGQRLLSRWLLRQ